MVVLEGKVCDLRGMACLADHAEYLLKSPSELGCKCPQSCNIITYVAQAPKMTVWYRNLKCKLLRFCIFERLFREYGYFDQRITFRWGLLPPTTKYHRNVLFGFEDLVGRYFVFLMKLFAIFEIF